MLITDFSNQNSHVADNLSRKLVFTSEKEWISREFVNKFFEIESKATNQPKFYNKFFDISWFKFYKNGDLIAHIIKPVSS